MTHDPHPTSHDPQRTTHDPPQPTTNNTPNRTKSEHPQRSASAAIQRTARATSLSPSALLKAYTCEGLAVSGGAVGTWEHGNMGTWEYPSCDLVGVLFEEMHLLVGSDVCLQPLW